MFTLEQLEQKHAAILNQQKMAEQMFHQCSGALSLVNEQIQEAKKAQEEALRLKAEQGIAKECDNGEVDNEGAQ